MTIKSLIKKLLPQKLVLLCHYLVASLASFYYGFPSKKMVVIGVTGTKGKTSTANFIWSSLTAGGYKTGLISTANIRIGEKETLNKYHMTMPGRFIIQKLLSQMLKENCQCCVVETTSEGIKQWRHKGIFYDIAVFTSLSPEHLESHGNSFEEYKKTKGRMFAALSKSPYKILADKRVEKIIIVNSDSPYKDYFLNFWADKKITFGLNDKADYVATNIKSTSSGVQFFVNSTEYKLNILGVFNVYNALPAIVISSVLGIPDELVQKGLQRLSSLPGRMEKIDEGQNFTVIVDYAHEKESMTAALDSVKKIVRDASKIIVLLGAEGGGRDKAKRPIMGKLAGQKADFVIVSNVDPYEDDPIEILEDIANASEKVGKIRNRDLFVIEDRREGIRKALSLAQNQDIVLITGKGAEQSIVINGIRYPWDDRLVVREELRKKKFYEKNY